MGDKSKIEWTEATWNPVTGCSHVSEGCRHCYAERMSLRFGRTKLPWTAQNAKENVVCHEDRLDQPFRWKRPRVIFVNSMSDLFHEQVPDEFIQRIFAAMIGTPHHTYQVLTKRADRMADFLNRWVAISLTLKTFKNIWLGVSVENQKAADERIPLLLKTPAAVRFLSCEPLLGPANLNQVTDKGLCVGITPDALTGQCGHPCKEYMEFQSCHCTRRPLTKIDWVIVGGESGPKARPMHPKWATDIRDQCQSAGVPFFFKQWGEWIPKTEIGQRNEYGFQVKPEWLDAVNGREWGCLDASGHYSEGTTTWNGRQLSPQDDYEVSIFRVGKKRASRLLEGREWNEFPKG